MTKINKKQFSSALALVLLICLINQTASFAKLLTTKKGDTEVNGKVVKEEEGKLTADKKPIYYELIHENLRPDANEFYLSTIYGTPENPRALIKRSQNQRAGELYTGNVEYGIGDKIADDLEIVEINFRQREVVVQDTKTKDYYGLKLSYGSAVSRLVKKPSYTPPKTAKKPETPVETKTETGTETKELEKKDTDS